MVIARHALPAVHATLRRPADADLLADLDPLGGAADIDDDADRLVPEHRREPGPTPVVVEHREVGVAEPAVLDPDFYLFVAEGTEVDLLADELLFRGCGNPGIDHGHGSSPMDEKEASGVQEQFGVLQEQVSMLILSTVT
jgi:hypothetical protein